jgi:hypothetical protein
MQASTTVQEDREGERGYRGQRGRRELFMPLAFCLYSWSA